MRSDDGILNLFTNYIKSYVFWSMKFGEGEGNDDYDRLCVNYLIDIIHSLIVKSDIDSNYSLGFYGKYRLSSIILLYISRIKNTRFIVKFLLPNFYLL